jgi:hypothetical protein
MTVVVVGIRVAIHDVDPVAVVDEAIGVTVDPVAVAVGGVGPNVRREVRVAVVDAGVDDDHDDVSAATDDVPSFGGIYVRVGGPSGLSRVVEVPELRKARIVRDAQRVDRQVEFGIEDVGAGSVGGERGIDGAFSSDIDDLEAVEGPEAPRHRRAEETM